MFPVWNAHATSMWYRQKAPPDSIVFRDGAIQTEKKMETIFDGFIPQNAYVEAALASEKAAREILFN